MYETLRMQLDAADLSPAACHGQIVGALCVGTATGSGESVDAILAAAREATPDLARVLEELAIDASAALADDDEAFVPLLPDDEAPLHERLVALAAWCDGFLLGLATQAGTALDALDGEAREFVADLATITRVQTIATPDARAERDYAEVVEYVRAGVMILRETFRRGGSRPEPRSTGS